MSDLPVSDERRERGEKGERREGREERREREEELEGNEQIEKGGRGKGEKFCYERKVTSEIIGTSGRVGDQLNEDQVGDTDTAPVMTHLTDLFQRYFDKG
jgi:hypothetical protein